MSGARWFLIDFRYLSVSVKIEYSAPDAPVEAFTAYILDITLRPLFALHIASVWTAPFRCLHFCFLLTSFESFSFNSDLLETDEECIYPSPGYPGLDHLLATIWREIFFAWILLVCDIIEFCQLTFQKALHWAKIAYLRL